MGEGHLQNHQGSLKAPVARALQEGLDSIVILARSGPEAYQAHLIHLSNLGFGHELTKRLLQAIGDTVNEYAKED